MPSLNSLKSLRRSAMRLKWLYYVRFWKMDLDPTVLFSLSVKFDKTYPKGVHIGAYTYVAFDAAILAHDMTRGLYLHTRIGRNCFIGARSIVMPGVTVGDGCIVGSGAVVTKDVPAGSIVAGNPAQVIRSGVELKSYGRMQNSEDNVRAAMRDGVI